MYICICNAIKEADLREVARCCAGNAEDLYRKLGREPMCYQCIDEAERVVEDARAAANVPATLPH
ncbi:MAG: ferredoxin [Novosphingobium sp.]|nr:ferredoxin [Novosphingobium sp.]